MQKLQQQMAESASPKLSHALLDWIGTYRLNEYADIIGLAVTLLGFAVALWQVYRTRKVAEAAKEATDRLSSALGHLQRSWSLQDVIADLEELKPIVRNEAWAELTGRASRARKALIHLRGAAGDLSSESQRAFQAGIAILGQLEDRAHRLVVNPQLAHDVFRMISGLTTAIDALNEALQRVRNESQRAHHA